MVEPNSDKETLIHSAIRRFSTAFRLSSAKVSDCREMGKKIKTDLICRPEDNPNYILKACSKGLIEVVNYIIDNNPEKLFASDTKGWTCVHHAANADKEQIIELLLSKGADINVTDNEGNTPLHLAAAKGLRKSVRYLLTKKANANVLNNLRWAPVHVAIMENKPEVIDEMGKFPDVVDLSYQGCKGWMALHIAAKLDSFECAEALLRNGSNICHACYNGLSPLHVAAKYGSAKTLDLILGRGEELGHSRGTLLTKGDKEGNSPLHISVSSGNLNAVKICLEYGAEIDFCQENQSTPLHFACAQGILPIVRLMYETHVKRRGSEKAKEILSAKDIAKMTPIHRAALFDHSLVVAYLVEQGSGLEDLDVDKRTPLLLAAYKKSIHSICVLVKAQANIHAKDVHNRNVMHYLVTQQIVRSNCVVDTLKNIWQSLDGPKLVNEKDLTGCSPLHYASRDGNLKLAETLITLGATINLKDNDESSPLHFASKYGRSATAKRLLESQIGLHIINETDHEGNTALHVSSANGHTEIVHILCEKGALIHKNFLGQNPLHLAAKNGYVKTMSILISFHPNLLDQVCHKNYTALHHAAESNQASVVEFLLTSGCENLENCEGRKAVDLAIENGCIEAATIFVQHDRWSELLQTTSQLYGTPMDGFIQLMPEVYHILLERCHTKSVNVDPRSHEYWEKFNFNFLQSARKQVQWNTYESSKEIQPLSALNRMVEYGREELLSHPVCQYYLKMKWRAYGFPVFTLNFSLYATFVLLLTTVVLQSSHMIHIQEANRIEAVSTTNFSNTTIITVHVSMYCTVTIYFMLVFLGINCFKEFTQMWHQRLTYVFDIVNYVEWGLYITTAMYIIPMIMQHDITFHQVQWQCGAVAVFLAWFNVLLFMERIDSIGIYVIMFERILKTVLKVIVIFSVLFIAFSLAFYILLNADIQGGFRTPLVSFEHTVMLMMGDWNFVDLYQKPYLNFTDAGVLYYPELNFVFLNLFVVLIPILFINLLIGLAVGDIEMVRRDAQLKKLSMQVEYHTNLEPKLPFSFLEKVDRTEMLIYPNRFVQQEGCLSNVLHKFQVMVFGSDTVVCPSTTLLKGGKRDKKEKLKSDIPNRKLKEMQSQLDYVTSLLRLIVQKMDITQETED